jgi:hypothetical protein
MKDVEGRVHHEWDKSMRHPGILFFQKVDVRLLRHSGGDETDGIEHVPGAIPGEVTGICVGPEKGDFGIDELQRDRGMALLSISRNRRYSKSFPSALKNLRDTQKFPISKQ